MQVLLKFWGRRCGFVLIGALVCLGVLNHSAQAQKRPGVLTGKEKLAGKATDEQRVNNCKVPLRKRGAKARPEACGEKGASNGQKAE